MLDLASLAKARNNYQWTDFLREKEYQICDTLSVSQSLL